MRYNIIVLTLVVIFTMILVSCNGKMGNTHLVDSNNKGKLDIDFDPIAEKLEKMTLEEKIGQLVIAGIDGIELDENTINLIEQYYVGGFILFKKNIINVEQTVKLINSIKEANGVNKTPLFIGLDEEGGRVSRLPDELIKLPRAKDIGTVDNENFTYEIGYILGENLSLLGFNMDFAPVLDIHSNPQNTVIGDRAFGNTPTIVSRHGLAFMNGLNDSHIVPVVKHFPGHGNTVIDSHMELPTVNKTVEELNEFELIPFKNVINNGVDAIMIGHIQLSKIDSMFPATLSKAVIDQLLRGKLGYEGIVITDDMTMGAITNNYNIGEAAVKSLMAGSDILLVCFEYDNQANVLDSIRKAVLSNEISMGEIDKKVYNILKLKEKYHLIDSKNNIPEIKDLNVETNKILTKYLQ